MPAAATSLLSRLTDQELYRLDEAVSGLLRPILKIEPRDELAQLETQLGRYLTLSWKATVRAALREVEKAGAGRAALNKFLSSLGVRLARPLAPNQLVAVQRQLEKVYKVTKKWQANKVGTRFLFTLKDSAAVSATSRHQAFWVGDFYSEHLAERIRGVAGEVLEAGLGTDQAGRRMREVLEREFGLLPGGKSGLAQHIPARFAGNPDHYMRILAATSKHQSQTFATVNAFVEGGIRSYMLINPMDRRTGKVCQFMHGQKFETRQAVGHMNKIIRARSPLEVKNIAPWMRPADIEAALGNAKAGSPEASAALAGQGQTLPPFHPLCRTEVVAA